jgi:hypothetical protein
MKNFIALLVLVIKEISHVLLKNWEFPALVFWVVAVIFAAKSGYAINGMIMLPLLAIIIGRWAFDSLSKDRREKG